MGLDAKLLKVYADLPLIYVLALTACSCKRQQGDLRYEGWILNLEARRCSFWVFATSHLKAQMAKPMNRTVQ